MIDQETVDIIRRILAPVNRLSAKKKLPDLTFKEYDDTSDVHIFGITREINKHQVETIMKILNCDDWAIHVERGSGNLWLWLDRKTIFKEGRLIICATDKQSNGAVE